MGIGDIFPEAIRSFIIEEYLQADNSLAKTAHKLMVKFPEYAELLTPGDNDIMIHGEKQEYWHVIFAIEDYLVNSEQLIKEQTSLGDYERLFKHTPVVGGSDVEMRSPGKINQDQDTEYDVGLLRVMEEGLFFPEMDVLPDENEESDASDPEHLETNISQCALEERCIFPESEATPKATGESNVSDSGCSNDEILETQESADSDVVDEPLDTVTAFSDESVEIDHVSTASTSTDGTSTDSASIDTTSIDATSTDRSVGIVISSADDDDWMLVNMFSEPSELPELSQLLEATLETPQAEL